MGEGVLYALQYSIVVGGASTDGSEALLCGQWDHYDSEGETEYRMAY